MNLNAAYEDSLYQIRDVNTVLSGIEPWPFLSN